MSVFYSEYTPLTSAQGVEGKSLVDLTSVTFANLFASAADYSASSART